MTENYVASVSLTPDQWRKASILARSLSIDNGGIFGALIDSIDASAPVRMELNEVEIDQDLYRHRIGNRIRQLRVKRDIQLTELSRASGINKSTLSNLERGLLQSVDVVYIRRIAMALGVSICELVEVDTGPDAEVANAN